MTSQQTISLHKGDLPEGLDFGDCVAIDTETLGLVPRRDRLCVVQLSRGDGTAHVVQIAAGQKAAPNLTKLLADPNVTKLFHFARFDIAVLYAAFGTMAAPLYCTKIASKLARTYTDRHGLKISSANFSESISQNSSSPQIGVQKRSRKRRSLMPLPMCFICTRCGRSSMPCYSAKAGTNSPPPLSSFYRRVRSLISWAGNQIYFPTSDRFGYNCASGGGLGGAVRCKAGVTTIRGKSASSWWKIRFLGEAGLSRRRGGADRLSGWTLDPLRG